MRILDRIKSLFGRLPIPAERPLISVVLLLRRPAQLTEDVVRAAAERAWGRAFRPDSNEYVTLQSTDTRGPVGFVSFEGLMFQILCGRRPYCDIETAARDLVDMREQEAMRSHRAFMVVDFFRPQNPSESEKTLFYRRACSLLADLLDHACLAVYFPETGDFRVHDSALREALVSKDPLRQINHAEHVPVVPIEGTDAALEKAVAEARRRWPEFVQAFHARKKDQVFSVKAPFSDGENTEWMWVIVTELRSDTLAGELGNAPVNVKGLHEGAHVEVLAAEIGDWIYGDGNQMAGGFSVKVLAKSMRKSSPT